MKILYIDRDEDRTEDILSSLSPHEVIIERLENVSQAIRALLTSRYDMVISDIFLQDLDGYDLLKLMKKFDLNQPVVFYTDKDDDLEKAIAEHEGAYSLVKKGDSNELNKVVQELSVVA